MGGRGGARSEWEGGGGGEGTDEVWRVGTGILRDYFFNVTCFLSLPTMPYCWMKWEDCATAG